MSITATAPRVELRVGRPASALAGYLATAYGLLVDAGRVLPPDASAPADLVHTVGEVAPPEPGPLPVRTVDTVPLRHGRLAVAPGWLRHERRHSPTTTWLAHGYTAGRLLLDARLAPSGRLHCLPLVGTLAPGGTRTRAAERAATRARLDLAPGARLVVTTAPDGESWSGATGRWQRDLAAAHRTDIRVVQLGAVADSGVHRVSDGVTGQWLADLPLCGVLAGCDIFVTTERELAACSPAVTAADWGIPVIAAATDSAAELVLTRGAGVVVAGGDGHVARAVLDELDSGLPHARTSVPIPPVEQPVAECARALLGVYRRVLRAAVIGGAA